MGIFRDIEVNIKDVVKMLKEFVFFREAEMVGRNIRNGFLF